MNLRVMIIRGLSSNLVLHFLQDAYFLYLDVNIRYLQKTYSERIANPIPKMTFLSPNISSVLTITKIMGKSIPQILESDYGIDK